MFKMFFECIHSKFRRIRRKFGFIDEKVKIFHGKFSNILSSILPEAKYSGQKTKINIVGKKIKYLYRKKGTAVLEAALCIPVLLYLMFFTLEVIRVGVYQVAVDNMALKLAFEYSGLKSSTNFEKVIEDSKPAFFKSMDGIYCRIHVFPDLDTLMKSNKTNETPEWLDTTTPSIRYSEEMTSDTSSGCAFIVTVSYKFPFSSEFIKKLFAGGKNIGDNFLLWGKAINVCS